MSPPIGIIHAGGSQKINIDFNAEVTLRGRSDGEGKD